MKDAGGTVLSEKDAVPGQGYFAYCRDTEGNVFGIFEANAAAAPATAPVGAAQDTKQA